MFPLWLTLATVAAPPKTLPPEVQPLKLIEPAVTHLGFALSGDGSVLACNSETRGRVVLLDPKTGKEQRTFRALSFNGSGIVGLSRDGKTLVTAEAVYQQELREGEGRHTVRFTVWDVRAHKERLNFNLPNLTGTTTWEMQMSPQAELLAVHPWADSTCLLYDLRTGKRTGNLPCKAPVLAMVFSPDAKLLATANFDKNIYLWDVAKCECVATLERHLEPLHTLAFSPDGKLLASGDTRDALVLWDVPKRKYLRERRIAQIGPVYGIAFSPDGSRLATIGGHPQILLWDVETLDLDETFLGRRHRTTSKGMILFSGDGRTLLTGGGLNQGIRVWDVPERNPRLEPSPDR